MSGARALGLTALAVFASLAGLGRAPAAAAHRLYPTRLLVYAQEFSLSPSRGSLAAGPVVVELWNRGWTRMTFAPGAWARGGAMVGRVQEVAITLPGRVSTARWTLRPGRYELYCSMPGHLQAGMHVQITVRRRVA